MTEPRLQSHSLSTHTSHDGTSTHACTYQHTDAIDANEDAFGDGGNLNGGTDLGVYSGQWFFFVFCQMHVFRSCMHFVLSRREFFLRRPFSEYVCFDVCCSMIARLFNEQVRVSPFSNVLVCNAMRRHHQFQSTSSLCELLFVRFVSLLIFPLLFLTARRFCQSFFENKTSSSQKITHPTNHLSR